MYLRSPDRFVWLDTNHKAMRYYHTVNIRGVGRNAWRRQMALVTVVCLGAATLLASTSHAAPSSAPTSEIVVGQAVCTLGFVLAGSDGMAEGLTAAHCGEVGRPVTTVDGTRVGTIVAHGPEGADIARVDIATSLTVYAQVGTIGTVHDIIDVATLNAQRPLLCKQGITTGLSCGPLIGKATEGYMTFAASTEHGDSGSPVYALTRSGELVAAGILEGSEVENPAIAVATPVKPYVDLWKMSVPR
jgi:hypothetical protein